MAITGSQIRGASVGDYVAWMVARNGYRDLIERQQHKPLLGSGKAIPVPFASTLDGTLLLATDGLHKYAAPTRICDAARSPDLDEIPTRLVDLVRLRSGGLQDDVALVVCRLLSRSCGCPRGMAPR
ncbi:MAG: hypothetical protein V2A73_05510 [Pseudomonadota bacterium]